MISAPENRTASRVDHLVYACRDLQQGIDDVERLLGVRAGAGGQHPGRGTHNALLSLGPWAYLEIIGPDPEQPEPGEPRLFAIDALTSPRLATWAAKAGNLENLAADAARQGIALGAVRAGSRKRPDGALLTWRYTSPETVLGDGLVPFFIDWATTPHPAATAGPGATLIALRAEHPTAARVREILVKLGLDLPVTPCPSPALIATIECPKGLVELR
jgi:glyoxalase-like protein